MENDAGCRRLPISNAFMVNGNAISSPQSGFDCHVKGVCNLYKCVLYTCSFQFPLKMLVKMFIVNA